MTRGRADRYSFLVKNSHLLLHAGLARRTVIGIFQHLRSVYARRCMLIISRTPKADAGVDMSNFRVLLSIVSAIVLFLYGLGAFSHEIQEVGGETLKKWLGRLT